MSHQALFWKKKTCYQRGKELFSLLLAIQYPISNLHLSLTRPYVSTNSIKITGMINIKSATSLVKRTINFIFIAITNYYQIADRQRLRIYLHGHLFLYWIRIYMFWKQLMLQGYYLINSLQMFCGDAFGEADVQRLKQADFTTWINWCKTLG